MFPNRFPENREPFSMIGSSPTNTTPKNPIPIPNSLTRLNRFLNMRKINNADKIGTPAYKTVPIFAVVVLIPKIKKMMFIVPKSEKGISFHNDIKKFFLNKKGEITIPAIKKRTKAKLNGGILTRPIFVIACVAPPKIDPKKIKIIAFCLPFIS